MLKRRKGIFYEASRDRYRVRLYKFNRVTHRSYHRTFEEAERALEEALGQRKFVERPKPKVAAVLSIKNMLGGLVAQF
jgi:hypothetical protein